MTSPVAGDYTERIVNRLVPLSTIRPHPDNWNTHPDSQIFQLEQSHNYLGQFRSVVLWQRPDGYIMVAGHGYSQAATNKHEQQIRADILPEDTPPAIVKAIMTADNLHNRNSVPDAAKLLANLQEQQASNVHLDILGINQTQVDALYKELEQHARSTDLKQPTGGSLEASYTVIIECDSEHEQRRAYDLAQQEGFVCRIVTL